MGEFAAIGDSGGTADCLDGLARLGDDPQRAGRLVGAAERLRRAAGRRPIRADQPPLEVPATARSEGAELPLAEVLEAAVCV